MTVKELKRELNEYDDDMEVQIQNRDEYNDDEFLFTVEYGILVL